MMDVDQGSVKLPVPPPPPPPMLPRPISNDERGKNLLSHHLTHIDRGGQRMYFSISCYFIK